MGAWGNSYSTRSISNTHLQLNAVSLVGSICSLCLDKTNLDLQISRQQEVFLKLLTIVLLATKKARKADDTARKSLSSQLLSQWL